MIIQKHGFLNTKKIIKLNIIFKKNMICNNLSTKNNINITYHIY